MRRPLMVLLVVLLSALSAAPDGPPRSTPGERAQAVRFAGELARDPLAAGASQKRQWLVAWYERIPDVTVTVCNLLGPLPPVDHPFFANVLAQSLFTGGAFIIEHPGRADDQLAVQAAAMEGSLRVYETYATAQPLYRLRFVDDLVARRKAGTLDAYLREAVPKGCATSSDQQ